MTTTTQIQNLKRHAAQMRTHYDQEGMAALTLQLFQRGLDEWQPIVAAPAGENGDYRIISGHRRRMARLYAFALEEWAGEHPEQEVTVEVARTLIATLSEKLGSVEAAAEALLQKYGEREIPFVPFSGDQKAEVLALQAANFGREEADMLGIAHSFRQALQSGASSEEIARNAGQSVHYVLNHLALTDIPAELAQRIAAGELPMSVARTVADLPEPKRTGMAIFLLANEPARLAATLLDIQDRLGIAFVLRFDMWSRALAMIGDRPLTGVGLNGYPLILSHFYPGYLLGPEPHAHNLALQTAVDLGVPGLLALLWLVVAFFAVAARAARQSTAAWQRALLVGLAGALLAYVAGGLLDAVTVGDKPLLLLWLLLGVGAAAGRLLPAAAAGDEKTDAWSRWWLVAGLALLAVAVAGLALLPGVLAGNAGAVRGHRALVAARATGTLPADEAAAAVRSLEQAVAQRPDDPDLHSLLGSLAAWQGDDGAALAHLERRVELDGPQALDRYAPFTRWQRQLAGEPDPAPWASTAQLYSQWATRYPGRAEETILMALVRQEQGQPEAAAQLVEAALTRGAQPAGLLGQAQTTR